MAQLFTYAATWKSPEIHQSEGHQGFQLSVYIHINITCMYVYIYIHIIEGSLEVKLPTIWTDEKQSRAEAERRGRLEERRSEEKE